MPPFVAITFLSLSDVALKYNVEIRMYALAALFVFLSYYYFYRIVKEDKLLNYILFMIFSLASAYTHYYALIAVAFFYVVLIFYIAVVRRTAFIQIIAIYLITIVAYLPWLRILIASVQNRVDNYWIEDIPTLGACFSFMVSEHFQNWMWGITICVFILAVLYQSGIVTVEKQDKKEYTLKVLQRPHGSAVLLLLLAGMASIVGTAAVGIILSKVLSPFFVTRYMYVVCPVWWFVLGVIFSKLKLSPVWTIPFLCYMMTYFIPAYQAIAGYDEYINNRTLLVLNTLDSIPEEDILIGNYSGNDVHLLGDYYLEGRQTLYIDYDLYSAQLPELNPSQQYWLIVNDDWDLTYLFEQFAAQGYECTNVLPDGLIAYGNVYIYRVDAVLRVGDYIYIIECKLDKSAKEAMQQIDDKGYADKYINNIRSGKKLVKIGMNFSTKQNVRNIDEVCVVGLDL